MTVLGIIAIIAAVVLGLIVLRVKSDPMEKESVRKILSEAKSAGETDTKDTHPPATSDQ